MICRCVDCMCTVIIIVALKYANSSLVSVNCTIWPLVTESRAFAPHLSGWKLYFFFLFFFYLSLMLFYSLVFLKVSQNIKDTTYVLSHSNMNWRIFLKYSLLFSTEKSIQMCKNVFITIMTWSPDHKINTLDFFFFPRAGGDANRFLTVTFWSTCKKFITDVFWFCFVFTRAVLLEMSQYVVCVLFLLWKFAYEYNVLN